MDSPLSDMSLQKESEWEREFVEKGADIEHDRWARWQKYLHSKLKYFEFEHSQGGNKVAMYVLDPGDYERWSRQIDTPYSELSESEKESDRRETRNYLPLVSQILANREKEIAEEVAGSVYAAFFSEAGEDDFEEFHNWRKNVLPGIILKH